MQAPAGPAIRDCVAADRTRASHALAQAFQDDPVIRFIFPRLGPRRARSPGLFALLFDGDGSKGARITTLDGQAVTLWQAPGSAGLSWREKIADLVPWWRATGSALGRALAYSDASDANRPAEPHWYLHVAGCAPSAQGRGYGRAVIRAGLERADRDGLPTYLETSNPGNVGYYASMGFAVTHQWRVRRRLLSWSMLRPATRGDGLTAVDKALSRADAGLLHGGQPCSPPAAE